MHRSPSVIPVKSVKSVNTARAETFLAFIEEYFSPITDTADLIYEIGWCKLFQLYFQHVNSIGISIAVNWAVNMNVCRLRCMSVWAESHNVCVQIRLPFRLAKTATEKFVFRKCNWIGWRFYCDATKLQWGKFIIFCGLRMLCLNFRDLNGLSGPGDQSNVLPCKRFFDWVVKYVKDWWWLNRCLCGVIFGVAVVTRKTKIAREMSPTTDGICGYSWMISGSTCISRHKLHTYRLSLPIWKW